MDELIKTFHIDWKLLIAQGINFIIVFSVLYYFGLRPLMKLMVDRSKKIDDGLKNAELIEENLSKSEQEKKKAIAEGRKQAQLIIGQSEKDAELVRQEKLAKTKLEAEKIVISAKNEITSERAKMIKEVKSELGELVLLASGKLTADTMTDKQQEKLIDQVLLDLEKTELK
ncbi:ATP synthase F0 subunit B [Candidatus Falkowbacteria bacterium RIFOXYD2_FULL_35_9]|uniref:ATP synthase subunit b n=1 Tax=Candidatus Falkowbacteria bacterium RIFOXYC2_FULL_36_12 TaxID=1798002 RepID=A0A1F5SZI6_9BACT|nr:MAG: ATP synthase F0 subunit B [Candidatus Falkowbacteria bacterium RIFOXYC2_FULL_36_12]OGF46708.1 MAG: ATP synthase F0 subunit B [Candidatus Falkowbacteria bacterium RIFOXYD2_FULL_35_9]